MKPLPYRVLRVEKFAEDDGQRVIAVFLYREDAENFIHERTSNEPTNRYDYLIVDHPATDTSTDN
jgi:hypothetical protein